MFGCSNFYRMQCWIAFLYVISIKSWDGIVYYKSKLESSIYDFYAKKFQCRGYTSRWTSTPQISRRGWIRLRCVRPKCVITKPNQPNQSFISLPIMTCQKRIYRVYTQCQKRIKAGLRATSKQTSSTLSSINMKITIIVLFCFLALATAAPLDTYSAAAPAVVGGVVDDAGKDNSADVSGESVNIEDNYKLLFLFSCRWVE